LRGILLGGAVGDALGLPAEGLSARRIARLYQGCWQHRLIGPWGVCSDDTEHAFFTAQSLLAQPHDSEAFARRLGWCLRGWLLGLPAGIGWATLRAIGKLWLGFPPARSGVASAGNGPAMRAAILGGFFADNPSALAAYLRAATRLTHTDPRALTGAAAVAGLAAYAVRAGERPSREVFLRMLREAGRDSEWAGWVEAIGAALSEDLSVAEFARRSGLAHGIGGYIYHTVPLAVYAWFRHFGDFRATLESLLNCGGDTDTVAAIAGGLVGAVCGEAGIPREWLEGIREWPRGTGLLRRLAARLAECAQSGQAGTPLAYFWPALIPRNALFLLIVLGHGLRRGLPPY
jgi:ADP-ribosylglycohydrolase